MKKFLQNPAAAWICALVIVLGSTVWNLDRSLEKRARETEAVWEAKYGMEEKLQERCSNAAQLWSVLSRSDALSEECAALRAACNALYDADMVCTRAHELYALNEELSRAARQAMDAAALSPLSTEDAQWAERYYGNMLNAQRLMDEGDYHEAQRQFAQLLNAPHVALLRHLLNVDMPEAFA
ncbi:MAG: hypothetical protein MJ074_06200 [Oscillospiraceae bacterium]|nr:hypothetical protein [Oscillospiraceae bacterium]